MLTQLSIHHLRNLQSVSIQVGQCNVFIGANGSGKTSLLESLYLLSRGKSFRHHQPKRYISHHAPHTTVHAKFADGHSMAIQKAQDASTTLRLGQQTVYVQSALTKQLPTLLIDPSSMDVLEIGSGSRRQLLDWITFHVKPGFHSQWLAYQRLLKQRNALLKQSTHLSSYQQQELMAWDKGLATHASLITHYRREAFAEWQPLFNSLIEQLLPDYAPFIQLKFSPGYNTEVGLDELLKQRLQQDCQTGYTRIGCHRADVQVLWVDDVHARETATKQHKQSSVNQPSDLTDSKDYNNNLTSSLAIYTKVDNDSSSELIKGTIKDNLSHYQDTVLDDAQKEEGIPVTEDKESISSNVREQAANVLSRGEKKLLITALRLSQLPLLALSNTNHSYNTTHSLTTPNPSMTSDQYLGENSILPVVLLDDVTAELDDRALSILLKTLSGLSCQVFITSLDESIMSQIRHYWPNAQLFHMKQGSVMEMAHD